MTGDGRTIPQHFDPEVLKAFRETSGRFAEVFDEPTQSDVSATNENL